MLDGLRQGLASAVGMPLCFAGPRQPCGPSIASDAGRSERRRGRRQAPSLLDSEDNQDDSSEPNPLLD